MQKTMTPSSEEKAAEFLHLRANHREPITHPLYELGDEAKKEDMIIFSDRSSKDKRNRGQDKRNESSYGSDDAEDRFIASIKELRHLDAAFIRRSNGRWTYALVANNDDNGIIFVVDKKGSTKTLTNEMKKWKHSVRRIKVLTQGRVNRS